MANGRMIQAIQNGGIRQKSPSVYMQLDTIATHVFLLRARTKVLGIPPR